MARRSAASRRVVDEASVLSSCHYDPPIPLLSVEGSARDCGRQLGYHWAESLHLTAQQPQRTDKPWWKHKPYQKAIARLAPHLPDVFIGMAQSAGLHEDQVGTRAPADETRSGCTSFALAPKLTAHGQPISGQTKDTPIHRLFQFLVLRVKMSDAPSMLTLTYPGWLFGHGFVSGRCSIFRNSLYARWPDVGLPHTVWGLLALHCPDVEQAMKLTRDYGTRGGGHVVVADAQGGIVGIEITGRGVAYVKPKGGLYTHANAICGSARLQQDEQCDPDFDRANSLLRQDRLRERLSVDRGRITAPLVFAAMADHQGHPKGICRHLGTQSTTNAAVVVEPTLGLLHACRGRPCENFPVTYQL